MFGDEPKVDLVRGDLRERRTAEEAVDSVAAICCCIGTTAFPSGRWSGTALHAMQPVQHVSLCSSARF